LVRQALTFCKLLPYARALHKDFSPKETIANNVIMVLEMAYGKDTEVVCVF
jgi:hypothetical protein